MLPFKKRLLIYLGIGLVVFLTLTGSILFLSKKLGKPGTTKPPEVALPTIFNGELVLPKVTNGAPESSAGKVVGNDRLSVVSANLVAVFENNKLTGIRVVGELGNGGENYVTAISPVVRFLDTDGNLVAQKIARLSTNFDFRSVGPKESSLYDVTVDNPPQSDKLEILFNTVSSSPSATFEALKISNRNLETKTANINTSTESAATASGQSVDYYVASGQVVNPYPNPVTEITIYAWAKDESNKVFALGRTDFKNDLINSGEKIDFKVMLIPLRSDQKYSDYDIAAWGREYKLSF